MRNSSEHGSPEIKTVSFDVWQTIVGFNQEFNTRRESLFFRSIQHAVPDLTEEVFLHNYNRMKHDTELQSEKTGLHVGWQERMNHLARLLGLAEFDESLLTSLQEAQSSLAAELPPPLLSPHIPALFKDITQSNRNIALISNTGMLEGSDIRTFLGNYGVLKYVDHEIYSDKTSIAKPNPRVFQTLAQTAGVPAANILHIGDNKNADFAGAIDSGFQAICTSLYDDSIVKIREHLGL